MKRLFPLLFIFFLVEVTLAQSSGVSGSVIDSVGNKPIQSVTIALMNSDSSLKGGGFTDENGKFKIEIAPGTYILGASYIGYGKFYQKVTVSIDKFTYVNIVLIPTAVGMEEVEVSAKIPPVQMKGDTAEYNAQGYKTNSNANAKDLLGKMPGMETNGDVKAGGEKVQQVLVDGKPFFGQDANTALSTLPAEVVDKIQVFDDQSEQSKQSGVDDGTRVKTINIVTKINMRNGEFGRAYAGYGTDSRYASGANLNIFRGDQRISLLGQFNNINQQNFSTEDLLGVTGDNSSGDGRRGGWRRGFSVGSNASDFMVNTSNGITRTLAGGMNYQNTFGKKFEMSGSYFLNQGNSYSRTSTFQNYYLLGNGAQQYNELDSTLALNTNHRLTARLHYKLSEKTSFFMLPRISLQLNEGNRYQFGLTTQEGAKISELNQLLNSNLSAFSWENDLMYRQNFDKKGRSLFISAEMGQAVTNGEKLLDASSIVGLSEETFRQNANLDNRTLSYEVDVRYSEPLNEKGLGLDFSYEISNDNSDYEKFTYDELQSNQLIDSLSNTFNNDWLAHEFGFGLRKFDKGSGFVIRMRYELADLINTQEFPTSFKTDKTFHSIVPFALYRKVFEDKSNMFLMYRASTDAPSATQLQQLLDNSNPLQLSIGNSDLIRQYEHMLRARYQRNNLEKSRVMYIAVNGRFSNNYLGRTIFTAIEDTLINNVNVKKGSQLSSFANLKGFKQFDFFFTYGFPVSWLKSNLNFNLSTQFSEIPSLINTQIALTQNQNHQLGFSISSNISENLDFNLSTESSYNLTTNSLNSGQNSNYLIQNSRLKLDWITKGGFTLRTSLNHQVYAGLSSSLDNDLILWNLGIGKQLFKDQRGEIQLSVFDLLGQNNSISQNFYDSYYQEQTSNVLTRYFMLSFTYNFRMFRAEKSAPETPENQ